MTDTDYRSEYRCITTQYFDVTSHISGIDQCPSIDSNTDTTCSLLHLYFNLPLLLTKTFYSIPLVNLYNI